MTTVYNDGDYEKVLQQKKKIFGVFMGVTVAYVAWCVAWLIFHISLPYGHKLLFLPKLCVFTFSALYVCFAFPFMGIKYHRVRRYYKMMYYVSEGLKNVEENYFVGFEVKPTRKDYVDVTGCVFKTWSKKKCEWMEREAYFDKEKPLPDFERGDLVRYVVQGNFIVQYEIVERNALKDDGTDDGYDYYYEDGTEATAVEGENERENEE